MITRSKVLSKAVDDCMKELYSFVQPSVDWDDFIEQNRIYSKKYKTWERFNHLYHKKDKSEKELEEYSTYPLSEWEGKSIEECIGPKPFEFYYLPKDIMKDICNSYVHAYRLDSQQELLDTIEILKNYCKEPIVDKYIEGELREDGIKCPGHRGYDHPDNLKKEIFKIIDNNIPLYHPPEKLVFELQDKFFEFLDMTGNFYNWNGELNSFNTSVYLGASPYSNKEIVIDNWKKYRNKDIEINEKQIKKEYYGDEYDDKELG